MKKYFDKYFHLIYEIDLNKNSFLLENKNMMFLVYFKYGKKEIIKQKRLKF